MGGWCVKSDGSDDGHEKALTVIDSGITSDQCLQKCYQYYNNIQDVSYFSSCDFSADGGLCTVYNSPNYIAVRASGDSGYACWVVPISRSIYPTQSIQPTKFLASVTMVL